MIDIRSILDPQCTRAGVDANSRKRALEFAADLLAEQHDLQSRNLFDELMGRERLGSTGLGEGIAIPHCRIPSSQIHAACLRLDTAVDYEAIDGEPVDVLFILIVPPEENSAHLEILAELARLFSDARNREALRAAKTNTELFEVIVGLFSSEAA